MTIETRGIALWFALVALAGAAACKGDKGDNGAAGAAGTPAVDHGSISGTVKDATGAPVAGATVSTNPATLTAPTDATGAFTLASIPIGSYSVVASKTGYVDNTLTGVGVGAGGTVQVSLVLAAVPPTVGSLSGTIWGRKGSSGVSSAVAGAQVCVEGSSIPCATSQADGTYTLPGVAPGFLFVSASASGFLPGETRQATFLAAGAAVAGVDVTLSGQPSGTATYVGSSTCLTCHAGISPDVVSAWQGSAHFAATDRTLGHLDPTGWPPAPPSGTACSAPNTLDTGVTANDPVTNNPNATVWLVRREATCTPVFSMGLAAGATLNLATDTIISVTGTAGGVATGAGQCGNGGMIPAAAACSQGSSGWWQQEYLVAIGGAGKPAWVTWDTTATPTDMLVLPAAWNQRSQQWVAAPDYYPAFSSATPPNPQDGTFSKNCAGCHETGLSLAADASGHVTSYAAASPDIGCEKCHGPGSAHAGSGDAQLIVNPAYLAAQSEREVCGQCHSQGVSSTDPSGVFGFAWNAAPTPSLGGGNFVPGVHVLSDFQSAPAYGDPGFYWPSGFPSSDHETYIDLGATVHANNAYEKLTCADCHAGHAGAGGPAAFQRTDAQTGAQYVFQDNAAALRDDVICLSCHATHGSFAALTLEQAALYHLSAGGAVLKNGTALVGDQAAAASLVASTVTAHMMAQAAMPAYFDPTGAASGAPVGRCSSCHMAKTAFTGTFFSGPDASGRTANVIGDVTAHTFQVAWPDMSLATWSAATTWDEVMPNACGSCHQAYRFGK